MSDINELFHLPGKHLTDRKMIFDINLLPLNLSDGRNIGDLPGFYVYKAPKKTDTNRQSDILLDRKSTRLNSSHPTTSRMPSSA